MIGETASTPPAAVAGLAPVLSSAPARVLLSPPDVTDVESTLVAEALASGWVAPAGPHLTAFEEQMALAVGRSHAVAVSSGTAALHLCLRSWGIGPGDVVAVSTLTFAATVNAIRYVGAEPHFIDCDQATGNMSASLLEQALHDLAADRRNVAAVLPVDMLGKIVDYDAIAAVAQGYQVLCDAAESVGSRYDGRAAGSLGDAAVFSFNGNKIMTTSGGGMILTDDDSLAAHVRKLSTQAREPVPHYEHTEVGFNYRLSNILAALGIAQLSRLDAMLQRRRMWRARYRRLVGEVAGVQILGGPEDGEDNCWLTAVVVDEDVTGWCAEALGQHLDARGIETRPLWKPMHQQPVFRQFSATLDGSADLLFDRGLVLPSGSSMSEAQFATVEQGLVDWLASR